MRAAALLAALLVQAPPAPLPDGNAYVRRLLVKQRQHEERLDRYTYDLVAVREELDGHGAVEERRERRYEIFSVKGRPVRRLVAEDGRPLSPPSQAREDRRARELAEAVRAGRAVTERPGVRLSLLLDGYDFRAVGREEVDGRAALVLEFAPRPGAPDTDGDRLLRRVHGRVWVDEAEEEIVRADIANLAPVKLGGGLGTSISSLHTRLEFRKVDDAVWLPAEEETTVIGRAMLFKRFRTRIRRTYSGFRRFDVTSEEGPPVPVPSPSPSASPNLVPF